jgi:hypothetical protein
VGSAYVSDGLAMSVRTKLVVCTVLVVALATGAFLFWKSAQSPSFEEQYRTLMAAELIANAQFPFDGMRAERTLDESIEAHHAKIYGDFEGPGLRNRVVYLVMVSPGATRATFTNLRANAADAGQFMDFGESGTYAPHDYRVVTPEYAQWATYKDNVIMLGESWRRDPKEVSDTTLNQRANAMIRTAYKNYLRLFGD